MTPEKIFEVADQVKPEKFPFADGDEVRAFDKAHLIAFGRAIAKAQCEELAKKIEAMPFGTTGESFAVWIRAQHDIDACASDPAGLKLRSNA